ncbi:peptidoglycan-associated lipoprotein [Bryocella elongata]|uniref:Peptidoglycan-associated lipoprotein n=1 Tax=Bryocella elongata TaxID=863522 RepID=A0A1H5S398_9BACT|nr:outer membrane beta-barrel protein [Bryocella elongata]SEF44824.1 peptidoglycan-associated lipoprotein [Bryocella elongata]
MRLFLVLMSLFSASMAACSQQVQPPIEIALDYNFVHTNAPPAGCSCFTMQGGGGAVLWNLSPHFEPMFKASDTQASAINGTSSNLNLTSYLFGARSGLPVRHWFRPYGEAAVGVAHATGSMISLQGYGPSQNVFAATVGGGLLIDVTPRIAIQAVQADYYLATVPNGVNGHQNNLLVTAGVVLRFGERH